MVKDKSIYVPYRILSGRENENDDGQYVISAQQNILEMAGMYAHAYQKKCEPFPNYTFQQARGTDFFTTYSVYPIGF